MGHTDTPTVTVELNLASQGCQTHLCYGYILPTGMLAPREQREKKIPETQET